ncbi:MAG: beta-ketoacyl-ACP reductase [Bacteroidetes bacterium]|nr:beta-ketoacyl-ACP reductase [Bacteroidota bacterium]
MSRAIALALADEGVHVAFTYRSAADAAKKVVTQIEEKNQRAVAFQSDAKDLNSAVQVVDSVVKEFQRLDILVNNAGITRDTLIMRMSEQDWDEVLETNLKSAFNFSKAVCRQMMSQREGKIINITSIAGVIGNAGQANYSSAKAGMIGLTKTLAKELASRNIQVNAVAPGFVDTDMTEKEAHAAAERAACQHDSDEANREARGNCERCSVLGVTGRQLRHGSGAVRGRRYRHVDFMKHITYIIQF